MNRGRENDHGPKFTNVIESVLHAASVEDAVYLLRDGFGLAHATLLMNVSGVGPLNFSYVRTTYPPQWVSRYVVRSYIRIDPVIREGVIATKPFGWHELAMNAREMEFMADARAHGVGSFGHAFPTIDRFSRRSLLSVSGEMDKEAWLEFIVMHAAALTRIARILHDKALSELSLPARPTSILAPREAECLLWTARGKDAKAIAAILELSEYTVRSYLRTARQKLQCRTLSQAVAKAVQQRIINP